ncbi:hypothetical protein HZF08_16215 [Paenibacillus sp. CGMCC 1.16610]|uniref:Uncharacterized protein n=1 Tax=Paenibacillus anseongense TaxID=2682845 RepID=A0ABW9UK37_9BACL|nr:MULTISPECIES: hypothetical protein [Paenibacillus]MBA2939858.1 hypothetical protein [Paenibacillus sp. CGMCC 1.16610]MVQ39518.1 hypothetical protein [Paenibacillus anseongense]
MRWSLFCIVTIAMILISLFEWPKLKQKPKRDKAVFIMLLLTGWVLSMFDLPNTPGPTSIFKIVFKPLRGLIE